MLKKSSSILLVVVFFVLYGCGGMYKRSKPMKFGSKKLANRFYRDVIGRLLPDKAKLLIRREEQNFATQTMSLYLNDKKVGNFLPDDAFCVVLEPGEYTIRAVHYNGFKGKKTLTLEPKENYYFGLSVTDEGITFNNYYEVFQYKKNIYDEFKNSALLIGNSKKRCGLKKRNGKS